MFDKITYQQQDVFENFEGFPYYENDFELMWAVKHFGVLLGIR